MIGPQKRKIPNPHYYTYKKVNQIKYHHNVTGYHKYVHLLKFYFILKILNAIDVIIYSVITLRYQIDTIKRKL